MNLGGPAAAGLADGLRAVFFSAPVPSGCTLTLVLSSPAASSFTRTIRSRRRCSNTLSRTPFFDHRLIRVYMVCQLPKRFGSPRHLQPCSATWRIALSTWRFDMLTFPRCLGSNGAIRSN